MHGSSAGIVLGSRVGSTTTLKVHTKRTIISTTSNVELNVLRKRLNNIELVEEFFFVDKHTIEDVAERVNGKREVTCLAVITARDSSVASANTSLSVAGTKLLSSTTVLVAAVISTNS